MRKMVFGRQLSRGRKARTALFRGLVRALVVSGKITTSLAKAKGVSGLIDKLVSKAKKGDLTARRKVLAKLGNDRETVDALFGKVAPAFGTRRNGFTRIVALPPRRGDMAQMVRLEWSQEIVTSGKKQVTSTSKKAVKEEIKTR